MGMEVEDAQKVEEVKEEDGRQQGKPSETLTLD